MVHPDVTIANISLMPVAGQCGFCKKPSTELPNPLRKCRGCGIAKYCSQECQRSAWPEHKIFCRSQERTEIDDFVLGDKKFGFSTAMSIDNALDEWTKAHLHTLTAIVEATVVLAGGVDLHLSTPRAVLVHLTPRRNATEISPAKAFQISRMKSVHKDEEYILREQWDQLQMYREKENERIRANPTTAFFKGCITTAFIAEGTGMISFAPIRLRQTGQTDHTNISADTRVALTDFISLCKVGISYGHCYYRDEDRLNPAPAVGHLVRKSAKKWKRVPVKGQPWDVMATYMARNPTVFKSGLDPDALWALSYSL